MCASDLCLQYGFAADAVEDLDEESREIFIEASLWERVWLTDALRQWLTGGL